MRLLIHANGYNVVPWKTQQAEIRTVQHLRCGGTPNIHWAPSNVDFAAVGKAAGTSAPAATLDELVAAITRQPVGSIEELRIVGHANDTVFALGGEVRADDVYFTKPNSHIGDTPEFNAVAPKLRALQDRFTANAKVILMGCHAGSGKAELLKIVSHAFLRTVAGFLEEIKYNFEWAPAAPPLREKGLVVCTPMLPNSAITIRGRMMYSKTGNLLGDVFGQESMLGAYTTNPWTLNPDATSNDGDIFIPMRRKDIGSAAGELVWRILKDYFPGHVWVSGTSHDDQLAGLRVSFEGSKGFIETGPDFVTKATPASLANRVSAVGAALDLIAKKQAGVIPVA